MMGNEIDLNQSIFASAKQRPVHSHQSKAECFITHITSITDA